MVDEALILRKAADLELYGEQIREYKMVSLPDYEKEWKTQRVVERTLQMMIETCIDIAGHLIADQKMRIPKNYADSFKVLHENGIIEETVCDTMQKMARFRNIVVHNYDRVDSEIVIGILRKNLSDFDHFNEAIIGYLKKYQTNGLEKS